MKIALITDTHWGARNNNHNFHEYFGKFMNDVFFNYIIKNDVKDIIHLGDVTDRRKEINFVTAKTVKDQFFNPIKKHGINLHIIIGNHDTYYKNTNNLNSVDTMFKDYCYKIYDSPEVAVFDDLSILMMPWINSENYDECINAIETSKSQILMGHLQIAGLQMNKGIVSKSGLSKTLFNKFDMVMSGHFHHRSDNGNISYLGSPFEITWADCDDPRGFHIFDTETRSLTFIENPYKMFHKLSVDSSLEDIEKFRGAYLKLIVEENDDITEMLRELEEVEPFQIQVIDNSLFEIVEADEGINEIEDTITVMKRYISQIDTNIPQDKINEMLISLYNEALQAE